MVRLHGPAGHFPPFLLSLRSNGAKGLYRSSLTTPGSSRLYSDSGGKKMFTDSELRLFQRARGR